MFCNKIVISLMQVAGARLRDQSCRHIKSKAVLLYFMRASYIADVPKCEGLYHVMRKRQSQVPHDKRCIETIGLESKHRS